jgi:hypothetical protein
MYKAHGLLILKIIFHVRNRRCCLRRCLRCRAVFFSCCCWPMFGTFDFILEYKAHFFLGFFHFRIDHFVYAYFSLVFCKFRIFACPQLETVHCELEIGEHFYSLVFFFPVYEFAYKIIVCQYLDIFRFCIGRLKYIAEQY